MLHKEGETWQVSACAIDHKSTNLVGSSCQSQRTLLSSPLPALSNLTRSYLLLPMLSAIKVNRSVGGNTKNQLLDYLNFLRTSEPL